MPRLLPLLALFALALPAAAAPDVVVAEGERFAPKDAKGWKVTPQDDTYASHTYGGMWMTHGGCLGAPADSEGSVATQTVAVPAPGKYRVWSKYQAPPYFNYLHKVEVVQGGKTLFSHVYGKAGTPRLWSFSGVSDELFWYWGVDHDCAEAPKDMVALAAGPAEVRLVTVKNAAPAGNRFVDLVVLTTEPQDTYAGFKPYAVGSPFANEALAATKLYVRFRNAGAKEAQLTVSRAGHFQPQYGGATTKVPAKAVAADQWSEWTDVGPFCRLVHDEGLTLSLPGATKAFAVQFARDAQGKQLVGDLTVSSGENVVVPIDVTWRDGARVRASRDWAEEITADSKKWRRANGGKKPEKIRFYGAFSGSEPWLMKFKDTLGYNTNLPDSYPQVKRAFVAQHFGSPQAIDGLAKSMKPGDKEKLRVVSFGDEISLGKINYGDKALNARFVEWAKGKKLTAEDLGVAPDKAALADKGRLAWYSNLFNEEQRFAEYRKMSEQVKTLFGPEVVSGANYSPHHLALCYGPIYQWVDIFKHKGMSLFWAEDYVFSVPEVPQILSWMFGQMRCAVKYHGQPIHFYVMPHAPGQEAGYLRRNLVMTVGYGTAHVDNFWVAPAERFTENYVAWSRKDTFRVLSETMFDAAEVERYQSGGKVRPARVALVTGKANDFNESRLMVEKANDPFFARCANADAKVNQILCRKDQQYLYLALRQAQYDVDLLTEDDVADGYLKGYDVAYFAGEWIDRRAVRRLDEWVSAGGTLYAAAGLGHRNEFDEPDSAFLGLLGLKAVETKKNAIAPRTLLELPLAEPIDSLTLDGEKVKCYGMKQSLTPSTAKVLAKWQDGTAAATERKHGKGTAFAVGTLAGASWMRTGLRPIPYARGGRGTVYNPTGFSPAATKLACLGVDSRKPDRAAWTSEPGVEAVVMDHADGTLVTLVNWTNGPVAKLAVSVKLDRAPTSARSVSGQKAVEVKHEAGVARFTIDLAEGDFVMLAKK